MPRYPGPLLTHAVADALLDARRAGATTWTGSLDLGLSNDDITLHADTWIWRDQRHAYPSKLQGQDDLPLGRRRLPAGVSLHHLADQAGADGVGAADVRNRWHQDVADGSRLTLEDAGRKVSLIQPRGKVILDTCGGLGYFAAWCLHAGVARIQSYEKNADVIWLRTLNPWSPEPAGGRQTDRTPA